MKYRRLDPDGDFSFGQNQDNFVYEIEAVAQAIRTRLLLFFGEWWENEAEGLPMFQSILGQYNAEDVRNAAVLLVTERIAQTPLVRNILEVVAEYDEVNRGLVMNYRVDTEYGTIEERLGIVQ